MKGFKATVIKKTSIPLSLLYVQYVPNTFFRTVFPGEEKDMMSIKNSPHYKFLQLYAKIGDDIWKSYNDTDYIRLMKYWGRGGKYNRKKVANFIKTYKSIKSKGLKKPIIVTRTPVYKKVFEDGYEIYHGHHRAACCCILDYERVKCRVVKVKRLKR